MMELFLDRMNKICTNGLVMMPNGIILFRERTQNGFI